MPSEKENSAIAARAHCLNIILYVALSIVLITSVYPNFGSACFRKVEKKSKRARKDLEIEQDELVEESLTRH